MSEAMVQSKALLPNFQIGAGKTVFGNAFTFYKCLLFSFIKEMNENE